MLVECHKDGGGHRILSNWKITKFIFLFPITNFRKSHLSIIFFNFFFGFSWTQVQVKLNSYRSQLRAALEVHAFNRDVDDTCERIQEKLTAVTVDDLGKDLHSVEALIRKQEAVERDMTVIHEKLKL